MATFRDFFFGSNFAVWDEAIADIFQSIEDQREAARNAIYLSTALLTELSDHYGKLVGAKPDPSWELEVFRDHLQEVLQAYLMMSSSKAGVQQTVAATTQIPPLLRPISLLQRWLLGLQYFPNRFFEDLDGFITSEVDGPYEITEDNNLLILTINGVQQSFILPIGDEVTAREVIDSINSTIVGALAFPFGKRFALETIETDVGGSIKVEVQSTADTLFGLDNVQRDNAPVPNGTGVLPLGWRLTGSYIPPPPLTPEDDVPTGTDSQPISFDGALFGTAAVSITGTKISPFVGVLSPVLLVNGGFEDGFTEWDKTDGQEFVISTSKSRNGSKSLAVTTKVQIVYTPDGVKTLVPIVNTIKTDKKFIPAGCSLRVSGFNQAKVPGAVYTSPAGPPSVFEWLVSNGVYGYVDQQFDREPVVNDTETPTIIVTDTNANFIDEGVVVGMAIHVESGSYAFDGVIKGVSTHQLFIDQWRNGPDGGPTAAHISSDAAAGSSVTYTSTSLQDDTMDFSALGVQVGADFRSRDKLRVDETISHFGQVTTQRQIVRDIESLSTSTNPNDTINPVAAWGPSPTPESATVSTSGNPYSVYIRPPDGTAYTIYNTLNEIPDFSEDFAMVSARFEYTVYFYGFDGRLVGQHSEVFRPMPSDDYEAVEFTLEFPKGAEKAQLAISVGPDSHITENIVAEIDESVVLSQNPVVVGSETLVVQGTGKVLAAGPLPRGDYDVDYVNGTITVHAGGPARVADGTEIITTYDFVPKPGALTSVDDVEFDCQEEDLHTELHVAVDGKMQKIVFKDASEFAEGTISYTDIPDDADTVLIGDQAFEFDTGTPDSGEMTYAGQPLDGEIVNIAGATYEFDDDCIFDPGNIQVLIDSTADLTYTNLTNVINSTSTIVQAVLDTGTNTVTITATAPGHHNPSLELFSNATFLTITDAVLGTGTLVSDGIEITGTGTTFTTEVEVGFFIANAFGQAIRVLEVVDDDTLILESTFTIAFTGQPFFVFPGLTGGSFEDLTNVYSLPTDNVFSILISSLDETYEALVNSINANSTHVVAQIDTTTNIISLRAQTIGATGNEIAFESTVSATPFTLAPLTGHLEGGVDIHAVGLVTYTGQPVDGNTITIGTQVYEFDDDGATTGSNVVIQIGATADDTYATFTSKVNANGVVSAAQSTADGRVDLIALVSGTAGNSIAFTSVVANATLFPTIGFLSGAVNGLFANPDAPTCTEVAAYINARAEGFTASCDADDHLVLTSDTPGFQSALIIGHGSANAAFGFATDSGRQNSEAATRPGWRITVGAPGDQIVVISRAVQPANKFFGTDWTARYWIRSSSTAVKAQVIFYFEDENGNVHPSIANNPGDGTISTVGTAVTGTSTLFLADLQVGDLILAADQVRRVTAIATDTALTIDEAFDTNLTDEEYSFQHYTSLDPLVAVDNTIDGAVFVSSTARDHGRFDTLDVKLLLNDVANGDVIDIGFPFVVNEIGKSLHLGDNTIPRNKQREHRLYRMAVANPDVFTNVESGLVGAANRIEDELVTLDETTYVKLDNENLFPFSEIVRRVGIKAFGEIQYSSQPADGDTVTLGAAVFEFDNDATFTDIPVTIGVDAETTFQSLVDSINVNSPFVVATHDVERMTVHIEAILPGPEGNGVAFASFSTVTTLSPIFGTLEGGVGGADYVRGTDYLMRYESGEIARTAKSTIPNPTPPDLAITYSYFPGDVPLNQSYPQTIKSVGTKIEIDPTCLFFFRGRTGDFTNPNSINVNFDVVSRTPDRFSHLKPVVRGKYAQTVVFSASTPHLATLDFAAMQDQEAVLVKINSDGGITAIPFATDGWVFNSDTEIELSTASTYLAPGESALFEADATYEIVYFVKFQFTTGNVVIADITSSYALLPYAYRARQIDEQKEDVEQVLFPDEERKAKLRLPAVRDQSLAELTRTLGGQDEILTDDQWQFIDEQNVEIFLAAFDISATYTLTYKFSNVTSSPKVTEVYEVALSDDGITYGSFVEFTPGDVFELDTYVKFRVTAYGDFDVDDYRVRGFAGIAADATLQEGGFGLSPFGRYPFGDGGICLEDSSTDFAGRINLVGELEANTPLVLEGEIDLSGELTAIVSLEEEGGIELSGDLVMVSPGPESMTILDPVNVSGSTPVYFDLSRAPTSFSDEDDATFFLPAAMVFSAMQVFLDLSTPLPTGDSLSFTLLKNGLDTAMTVDIGEASLRSTRLRTPVTFDAGDRIALRVDPDLSGSITVRSIVFQHNIGSSSPLVPSDPPPDGSDQGGDPQAEEEFTFALTVPAASVTGPLTGFPLYIDMADAPAQFWAEVTSDGRDIRAKVNDSLVPIDIVTIDTGTETGGMFVKVDLSDTEDTVILISFGDSTKTMLPATDPNGKNAVWADYHAVYLLLADGTNRTGDSTKNLTTVTGTATYGAVPLGAGGGATVTSNWLLRRDGNFDLGEVFTLAASGTISNITGSNRHFCAAGEVFDTNTGRVLLGSRDATDRYTMWDVVNSWNDGGVVTLNADVRLHGVWNGASGNKLYRNGVVDATAGSSAVTDDRTGFAIGGGYGTGSYLRGNVGFVYARKEVMSAEWIAAEYSNLNDPGSFYEVVPAVKYLWVGALE